MTASKNQWPFHILLAVDGSAHTRAAVQLLCHLPLPPGSRVTAAGILPRCQKPAQEALSIALIETEMVLKQHRLEVKPEWLCGQPAKALTDFARAQQPDLIMVGASGLRATLGFLLGGTAQQVVELAGRPVLVVRPPCQGVRRVLLATEGSGHSWAAANYLARFPLPAGAEIKVLHVLPPQRAAVSYSLAYPIGSEGLPPSVITIETAEAMAQEIAHKESQGMNTATQAVTTLRYTGKKADCVLLRGDAITEITAYAKTQAIDLIVTGSRGFGAVAGWLMGSVSRQLIHYARCAVLVVKDQTTT